MVVPFSVSNPDLGLVTEPANDRYQRLAEPVSGRYRPD
jgi:hypothetical protein